ncbi:MAG TPA: hopanoid-associated sugar epimerase [Terriglobia bacterium]|nr:hopanoid-associated sugar epimerase [Terriglobia bacterium]
MLSLITGANGFIGSHVTRFLIGQGEQARVLVRPQSDLRLLQGLPVEFAYADLRDAASLPTPLRGAQRVYHVAADYRLWAKNPQDIYDSNVTGTRNLLAAARQAGIDRFIYTSSVGTIVPPHPRTLPDEETQLRLNDMIGHYKRSKFLAEQEALEAARQGQDVVIVNPTTPVGPGDWKPTPTGRIILDFLNGKMPAYVDTGLNFVAVEDVAKGHWLAAERGMAGARYILGDRNLTLKQLLEILSALSGRPVPRVRLPHAVPYLAALADSLISSLLRREPRIPLEGVRMARHRMFVDSSKATRELGFQPGPLEAAMERAVRWYIENGYVKATLQPPAARECAA